MKQTNNILKIDYKTEYIKLKELKTEMQDIAREVAELQLDYEGDKMTMGSVVTSAQMKRLEAVFPIVIPEILLEKYNKLSNNKKRIVVSRGILGAFRLKRVTETSKKYKDIKIQYIEGRISGWDLLGQIALSMTKNITTNRVTGEVTIA